MKKKTTETKEKKVSRSKTASTSSTTRTASSTSKKGKVKSGTSSSERSGKNSSQSSSRGAVKPAASSRRGQRRAKSEEPTWEDKGWETEGWSKPRRITAEEHAELRKVFDENGKPRVRVTGRPKKPAEEKLNSKPFRISERFEKAFKAMAMESGFKSWQEWLRVLGGKAAGLISEAN